LSASSEFLIELWQKHRLGMHQHDTQQLFPEVRVARQRVSQEVVDASDGLDTREATAGDHERQQALLLLAAIESRSFSLAR
jgi:hypothetical protein